MYQHSTHHSASTSAQLRSSCQDPEVSSEVDLRSEVEVEVEVEVPDPVPSSDPRNIVVILAHPDLTSDASGATRNSPHQNPPVRSDCR